MFSFVCMFVFGIAVRFVFSLGFFSGFISNHSLVLACAHRRTCSGGLWGLATRIHMQIHIQIEIHIHALVDTHMLTQ